MSRYSLTIADLTAVAAEPGTWAMMLVGFGAIGFAMRQRRKVSEAVTLA